MPYAVVQESLDPPTLEQLSEAFAAVPTLTRIDACTQMRDCYGILMGNISLEHANTLCGALGAQGVQCFVVDEAELPALPPVVICLRAELSSECLTLYDTLDRSECQAWADVMLLAAGVVKFPNSRQPELLLDLVLRDDRRFRVPARRAHYDYLADRRTTGWRDNFVLLVRDMAQYASGAIVARGAEMLTQEPPSIFSYPSLHGFEEEMVWHLWAFGGRQG